MRIFCLGYGYCFLLDVQCIEVIDLEVFVCLVGVFLLVCLLFAFALLLGSLTCFSPVLVYVLFFFSSSLVAFFLLLSSLSLSVFFLSSEPLQHQQELM